MAKFIFVTGGVTSSLGKGIIAASLQSYYRQGVSVQPFKNLIPTLMLIREHLTLTSMESVL